MNDNDKKIYNDVEKIIKGITKQISKQLKQHIKNLNSINNSIAKSITTVVQSISKGIKSYNDDISETVNLNYSWELKCTQKKSPLFSSNEKQADVYIPTSKKLHSQLQSIGITSFILTYDLTNYTELETVIKSPFSSSKYNASGNCELMALDKNNHVIREYGSFKCNLRPSGKKNTFILESGHTNLPLIPTQKYNFEQFCNIIDQNMNRKLKDLIGNDGVPYVNLILKVIYDDLSKRAASHGYTYADNLVEQIRNEDKLAIEFLNDFIGNIMVNKFNELLSKYINDNKTNVNSAQNTTDNTATTSVANQTTTDNTATTPVANQLTTNS